MTGNGMFYLFQKLVLGLVRKVEVLPVLVGGAKERTRKLEYLRKCQIFN